MVIGAGVIPDVTLAKAAGLELGEAGGVKCSSRLETSVPGIYAAGDICEYDSVVHGRSLRIEHWDVAFNQGKTAALNMLGRDVAARGDPVLLLRPGRLGLERVRRPRAPATWSSAARWTTASSPRSTSTRTQAP